MPTYAKRIYESEGPPLSISGPVWEGPPEKLNNREEQKRKGMDKSRCGEEQIKKRRGRLADWREDEEEGGEERIESRGVSTGCMKAEWREDW
jgi:hypothetical protein